MDYPKGETTFPAKVVKELPNAVFHTGSPTVAEPLTTDLSPKKRRVEHYVVSCSGVPDLRAICEAAEAEGWGLVSLVALPGRSEQFVLAFTRPSGWPHFDDLKK